MIEKLVVNCETGKIIECNYTKEEKQAIEQQKHEQLLNSKIIEEKVDIEKVAIADAIVDLNNRIIELENKLNKEGI